MADKYQPEQQLVARWQSALSDEASPIPVAVIEQTSPGLYRCATTMGIEILFKEEDLG